MTHQQQAKEIVLAAKFMRDDDAIEFVEARLRLIFTKGEIAGIQQVRQSLDKLGQPQTEAVG